MGRGERRRQCGAGKQSEFQIAHDSILYKPGWPDGRRIHTGTNTMERCCQLFFKRRLTLKLNPDFSLT
jgi:hypothetical protein